MKGKIARIILIVLATLLLVSVVACKTNEPLPIPEEFADDYVISPKGRIKANTYLRSGEQSELAFSKWIQAYSEEYPDVVVKPEIIQWSDFGLRIASGDIGDVFYGCESNVYDYAITHRAAMPLDSYIDRLGIDVQQVFTGLYDLGCANGYLFMVPSDLCPAVYYTNVSMLEEEGISMPDLNWTYDDFKDICRRVQKTEADGSYSQIGLSLDGSFEQYVPWFTGFGGHWVDKVNKKVMLSSDEKVLEGLSEIVALIQQGYLKVPGLTGEVGAKFANISTPANYAFQMGTYISRITYKQAFDELGLKMNVTCIPKMPTRVIYGGCTGFFVYSKTKNPDAAATFALYLLKDDGQRAFNSSYGGGVPTTKACYNDDYWRFPFSEEEFNYDAFICYPEAFVGNWPNVYVPTEVATPLYEFASKWLTNHFSNRVDYKDTIRETEKKCNELWAKLYNEGNA